MPKHKVSELEGPLLDLAVALVEGYEYATDKEKGKVFFSCKGVLLFWPEDVTYIYCKTFDFSTNWSAGGPLIEKHWITVSVWPDGIWSAYGPDNIQLYGPTPLIAAMRCYVASKLGEEIELPEIAQ